LESKQIPPFKKKEGKTALHTNFSKKPANVSFKKGNLHLLTQKFWSPSNYKLKVYELLIFLCKKLPYQDFFHHEKCD